MSEIDKVVYAAPAPPKLIGVVRGAEANGYDTSSNDGILGYSSLIG